MIVRARQPIILTPVLPATANWLPAPLIVMTAPPPLFEGAVQVLTARVSSTVAWAPAPLVIATAAPPPSPGWAWAFQVWGAAPFGLSGPVPVTSLWASAAAEIDLQAAGITILELGATWTTQTLLLADITMPPEQTLRIIRNQDLTLRFRMQPPQDITAWAITFKVRPSLTGTASIIKTVGAGITLTYPGKGILDVALAAGDTSSLTVTTGLNSDQGYVWELTRTDSGNRLVLARGNLILEQEIV